MALGHTNAVCLVRLWVSENKCQRSLSANECGAGIYAEPIHPLPPKDTPHLKSAVFLWISNICTSLKKAYLENTNFYQNNLFIKRKDFSGEEFKKINEEHNLSLRKKRNNKHMNHIKNLNLAQNHFSYNIDINLIINNIKSEEIYLKYKNSESELEKLNYLMQMIISKNNDILKCGLFELKKYLSNIKSKKEFESKNLLNYFNEKMFRFLFELLFKKNDAYLNL